jgi:Lrp/AsnC family transcriptional regulator, regulator for asnA, asnC and gidA
VQRRYNRLKRTGIICEENMHLNPLSVGYQSRAEIGIITNRTDKKKVAELFSNRKLLVSAASLGKYDVYGDLYARRTDELMHLVQQLDIKPYVKSLDVLIYADLGRSPWHPENVCLKQFCYKKSINNPNRQGVGFESVGFQSISLDERDKCIVKMLVENSRTPFKDIAKQMNIPIKSVIQKYKALREKNVLYLSTIAINPAMLGFEAVLDLYVNVENRGMLSIVEEQLLLIPNMTFCAKFVGGAYDLRAACLVSNIAEIFAVKRIVSSFEDIRKKEYYLHELPSRWFSIKRSMSFVKQLFNSCES